ncbi:MAG: hypothetical protein AWU57_764 [Marinobacter sp. T13-3]|jgi:hypothetical protein|nr:MAG: hypothetical protein AWU57_764 [Marinobacter sp. T13-3]
MAKQVIQALDQLELSELKKLSERELRHFALQCAHGCLLAETELGRRQPTFGERRRRRRARNRDVVSFSGERREDSLSFAIDLKTGSGNSR